jgi:hypothetical protein
VLIDKWHGWIPPISVAIVDDMLERSRETKDILVEGKSVPVYEWMKSSQQYGGGSTQEWVRDAHRVNNVNLADEIIE